MNILLTSVGRRAYIVRYFKSILDGCGEVHVCNSDAFSVAFQYADKSTISPMIYDSAYIPFLLSYCKKNNIDVILSLFDIDLPVLAKHKAEFEAIGTNMIVSNQRFVEICNDKWKTYQFLKEYNIPTPKTCLTMQELLKCMEVKEISYPVMIKPRFGCGSIAIYIADDESMLKQFYRRMVKEIESTYLKYESEAEQEKIIFQECLQGQEYGIDIINDLKGNFRNAIVKKKFAMRAGETDIAETVDEPDIYALSKKIAEISKHIGNVDMDVLMVDGSPCVLEMNARFGGGYPFSHMAGCNLPRAIVDWCEGKMVDDSLLQAQTGVLSYKEIVVTKGKSEI